MIRIVSIFSFLIFSLASHSDEAVASLVSDVRFERIVSLSDDILGHKILSDHNVSGSYSGSGNSIIPNSPDHILHGGIPLNGDVEGASNSTRRTFWNTSGGGFSGQGNVITRASRSLFDYNLEKAESTVTMAFIIKAPTHYILSGDLFSNESYLGGDGAAQVALTTSKATVIFERKVEKNSLAGGKEPMKPILFSNTGVLSPGKYSLQLRAESNADTTDRYILNEVQSGWSFNFELTPVPGMPSGLLFVSAILWLGLYRIKPKEENNSEHVT